ncbi:MAG: hypothetical protein HY276_06035 [Ignavibacteriales bacterium]|nr:hypothetical protein [Ignavibacteriales bacterium]
MVKGLSYPERPPVPLFGIPKNGTVGQAVPTVCVGTKSGEAIPLGEGSSTESSAPKAHPCLRQAGASGVRLHSQKAFHCLPVQQAGVRSKRSTRSD